MVLLAQLGIRAQKPLGTLIAQSVRTSALQVTIGARLLGVTSPTPAPRKSPVAFSQGQQSLTTATTLAELPIAMPTLTTPTRATCLVHVRLTALLGTRLVIALRDSRMHPALPQQAPNQHRHPRLPRMIRAHVL